MKKNMKIITISLSVLFAVSTITAIVVPIVLNDIYNKEINNIKKQILKVSISNINLIKEIQDKIQTQLLFGDKQTVQTNYNNILKGEFGSEIEKDLYQYVSFKDENNKNLESQDIIESFDVISFNPGNNIPEKSSQVPGILIKINTNKKYQITNKELLDIKIETLDFRIESKVTAINWISNTDLKSMIQSKINDGTIATNSNTAIEGYLNNAGNAALKAAITTNPTNGIKSVAAKVTETSAGSKTYNTALTVTLNDGFVENSNVPLTTNINNIAIADKPTSATVTWINQANLATMIQERVNASTGAIANNATAIQTWLNSSPGQTALKSAITTMPASAIASIASVVTETTSGSKVYNVAFTLTAAAGFVLNETIKTIATTVIKTTATVTWINETDLTAIINEAVYNPHGALNNAKSVKEWLDSTYGQIELKRKIKTNIENSIETINSEVTETTITSNSKSYSVNFTVIPKSIYTFTNPTKTIATSTIITPKIVSIIWIERRDLQSIIQRAYDTGNVESNTESIKTFLNGPGLESWTSKTTLLPPEGVSKLSVSRVDYNNITKEYTITLSASIAEGYKWSNNINPIHAIAINLNT